jgi:flagellar protein FliJ
MKRFRFTLQALQTVRQRQEQVALEQYSVAMQARLQAEAAFLAARSERDFAWEQHRKRLELGATAAQLAQLQAYCQAAELRCQESEVRLRAAEDEVHQKWQQFAEARKQREVVDKVEERQRRRYQRECAREEQKMLDELGLRDYAGSALKDAMDNLWN